MSENPLAGINPSEWSSEAQRNFITSLLPGFIEQGISGAETMQILRAADLHFSNEWFYFQRRTVLGIENVAKSIFYAHDTDILNDNMFAVSTMQMTSKYKIIAECQWFDPATGQTVSTPIAYDFSTIRSKSELRDEFAARLRDSLGLDEKYAIYVKPLRGYLNEEYSE